MKAERREGATGENMSWQALKNGVGWCLVWICLTISPLYAQENADCLECHADVTLSTERGGKTLSLYLDEKRFSTSAHGRQPCIGCHADIEGKELPHPERLERVNCGRCHSEAQQQFDGSLHGKALARGDHLAPRCETCHGKHHFIPPVNDPRSNVSPLRIPFLCGSCHSEGAPVQQQREIHQSHILENYSESIHGEGLLKKGLVVSATCNSCHTSHNILPHTDPRSSISRANVAKTCTRCHALIEDVHRKVVKGELWEREPHVIPACVDCHQPHKARKVFYEQGMADKDCLLCHGDPALKSTEDGRPLFVNADELKGSMHTRVACAQCHTGVSPSRRRACETVIQKVDCSICHTAQVEQYQMSLHGRLARENDPNAPVCAECHGTHGVLGRQNPDSPTFPVHVPALCARCHREGEKAALRYQGKEREIINHYIESIHGKGLLKSGLTVTAMCTNCHTAHRELPASDSTSTVNRNNIAVTCSQCHHGIYQKFVGSIHSPTVSKSGEALPVCSECHTAHTIRRTDEAGFRLEIMEKCGRCHLKITETYFDTYHGKVTRLGYGKTAKCYDCHGAHDILPVDDPRSHLSRNNVVETCRKCHPGATRRFAGYLTHATHHDPDKYPWLFGTFWGMTALLIATFSVSGAHTLLWLPKSLQIRRAHPPGSIDPKERQVLRFKPLHSLLHFVMIVSFMSLALTGMTLKFSYTGWAKFLSHVFGGFETAGYIHRVAATLMILLFGTHLFDLIRTKRAEKRTWREALFGPDTMLLKKRDFVEFWETVKWYLGRGERPRYGRWTYWEKFDYLAVFWGIAIIGSSGLLLWFSEFFTHFLPGWFINVATIIHSDEALLAVGFIFTVHFFNTHFRPDKFPMDISIFTGRVPLEELKRDRPAEYEALVAGGEVERHLVEPHPPVIVKTIRVFAWAALAVGLSLVVGIIYVFLFVYR